jgi:hypothetical protein
MKKYDLLAVFLLILTSVVFFNKLIFKNEIFVTGDYLRSDTLNQNLPFKLEYFNAIKEGRLPLWTNKIFGGYPLLAEGQTGVFYPVNFILYRVLNFTLAYNLSIVLNFIIAGIGMYYFAKSLGLKWIASLFPALVFCLASPLVLHITHQNVVAAGVWLPLIFLFNKKFFESRNLRYLFLSIATITSSFLAGSSQITFYIMVGLAAYLFIFRKIFKYNFIEILLFLALEAFLVLSLGAIQLFPQLELINYSTRSSGLGNIALDSLPYHPRNLVTLIAPYIFGDPGKGTYPHFGGNWGMFWENTLYLGLMPLLLGIGTVFVVRKKPDIKGWWLLGAVILFLTLGKYSPTFIVYYLPIFNYFRVTSRFLFVESFVLSILAGLTLDYLSHHRKLTKTRWVPVMGLVSMVSLIDLFRFGYNYNPTEKISTVVAQPEIVTYLKDKIDSKSRIFVVGGDITYDLINKNGWRNNNALVLNHNNSLDADLNMLWGLPSLDGYAGLFTSNFEMYKKAVYAGFELKDNQININNDSLKLLGVGSVEYVISQFELENPNLTLIKEFGEEIKYKLYENKFYLKRGVFITSSKTDLQKFLASDVTNNLYLKGFSVAAGREGATEKSETSDRVNLVSDTATKQIFEVNISSPKWFFLSDSYYPGWKAYIDERETSIREADIMFRAIEVPQGHHEITFKYEPVSYFYGLVVSLITLSVVSVWWIFYELRRMYY